jgi:N utilization substance protein B
MISRRNIRVKVMQTLYTLELYENASKSDKVPSHEEEAVKKLLSQHLDQTIRIFTYLLYSITEVARYAEVDARQRASKHLPSAEDLRVDTQIATNPYVRRLLEDPVFTDLVQADSQRQINDPELIKKIYLQLVQSEEYRNYIRQAERTDKEDRKILLYIFQELLLKSDAFDQHMEDLFLHWSDDRAMMGILVHNYFNKPQAFDFHQLISAEKRTYAFELLTTACEKKGYCLELIRPRLQNWDPDRIASIDMILMNMGICEFLYFPTIPTKVTINEYIDLAKTYSTPQSGQFVNGILDNVLKDLNAAQKIRKTDRVKK